MAVVGAESRKGNPRTQKKNILRRREERRGEHFGARVNEARIGEEEQWLRQPSRFILELASRTLNMQGSDDGAMLDFCPLSK
jgi:hypothetical protein